MTRLDRDRVALDVRGIVCKFDGLTALSDVTFSVRQGEVVGIIGPNGAGKTTLFNLISGVAKLTEGDILVFGRSVASLPPHKIAELGVVRTFQNIRLFETQTLLENVLVGCHTHLKQSVLGAVLRTRSFKEREADEVEHARTALRFFGHGLGLRETEAVRDLSYPDRRRVELARGLAARPRLLLLDEPTAGMTPDEAQDVVDEMRLLKENGYTVLVIEHRMDVVAGACDRVIVLDHGEKIAEGTPAEVASNPDVMRAYLGAPREGDEAGETAVPPRTAGPVPVSSPCLHAHGEGSDPASGDLGAPGHARTAGTGREGRREERAIVRYAGPVLELEDVYSSYGAVSVIQGVDLHVESGEIVVILGSNAAGKSTILKTILGQVPEVQGEIRFMGRRICGLPTSEIARAGIGIVPEGRRIFPGLTVLENLELGGYALGKRRAGVERIEEVLDLFPVLAERRNQPAGTLSGGEQQMLAISRALVASPKLICMDEPSMGLAPVLVDRVMQAIVEINRKGTTVLLIEQNARAALAIADRAYILRSGRIIASGPALDFLGNETVRRAYLS